MDSTLPTLHCIRDVFTSGTPPRYPGFTSGVNRDFVIYLGGSPLIYLGGSLGEEIYPVPPERRFTSGGLPGRRFPGDFPRGCGNL